MKTYSFTLAGARLAYLMTITRVDETVIRLTSYSKRLTIDGHTFYPDPGLEFGDYTESNNGEVPNLTFKCATRTGGLFTKADINNRLFEHAEARLYITDARAPTLDDLEIVGVLDGEVSFDPEGNAEFEFLNKFNLTRDVAGRVYTVPDDGDPGDPRRHKIPTFPTVDSTSDDLADVGRLETIALGERRRFRFAGAGNPSDYHNRYIEATSITTGITAGSVPSFSDTIGSTVVDGGVTWTTREAIARAAQVASILDESHITITVTEATGVPTGFEMGFIWIRSGYLKGKQTDLNFWDDGTGEIGLVVPFASLLEVGDWLEIAPGYDQSLDMAVAKYGSPLTSLTEANSADGGANNYRGFPHITGTRFFTSQFIPGVSAASEPDADDPGAGGGGGGGGGYEGFAVEFEDGSS